MKYYLNFAFAISVFFVIGCDKNADSCINKDLISSDPCPALFDPVCGCDGVTYDNECLAMRAGNTTIREQHCCINPDNITSNTCSAVFIPVCGCDGKEYGNECEAKKAGLDSWTDGPC